MFRTTAIALLLAASVCPGAALAADEDTQLWTTATVVVPLRSGLDASGLLSERVRSRVAGGDLQLVRANVDWRLAPHLALGGGATRLTSRAGEEWRAQQQAVVSYGLASVRTQVEERFVPGAPRPQFRLRERVQLAVRLSPRLKLAGAEEMIYLARTSNIGDHTRVEQWRSSFTVQDRVTPKLDISAGYMLIYAPRPGIDRVTHAPQLALTWRP